MLSNFDMVIFLGSSELLYNCARKARQFYGPSLPIKVIETSYTAMKRKYISEFGDIGSLSDKKSIFNFLRALKGKVLLFSINNPYILPKDLCENDYFVMINLHHALLPAHPGRNAEAWTIYEQDVEGGCTWHYISAGVDAGDIILQEKTQITEHTTSLSLLKQCEILALKSFEKFLPFEKIETYASEQTIKNQQIMPPKRSTDIPNNGIFDLTWNFTKQLSFLNAMNYGIAQVLGKPSVLMDGQVYTITSYKCIDSNDPTWNNFSNTFDGHTLVLNEKEEKKLVLQLSSSTNAIVKPY